MKRCLRIPEPHTTSLLLVCATALVLGCGSSDSGPEPCDGESDACACTTDADCADGLACSGGQCAPWRELPLAVSDPAARSCEVLAVAAGTPIVGAEFNDAVTGTQVREGDRSAVAFFSKTDTTIEDGSVALRVVGSDTNGPEIARSRCFDRLGRELASAVVSLQ